MIDVSFPELTAEAVDAERKKTGLGLAESKWRLEREILLAEIEGAQTVDDLKRVLKWLVLRSNKWT